MTMSLQEESFSPALRGGVAVRYRSASGSSASSSRSRGFSRTRRTPSRTRASVRDPEDRCGAVGNQAPTSRRDSCDCTGLPLEDRGNGRHESARARSRTRAARCAGDRAAQRELFPRRRPPSTTPCSGPRLQPRARGSVQDAFVAIFRALASFRGDSTLTRWCQTIAMRTAYATIAAAPRARAGRGDRRDDANTQRVARERPHAGCTPRWIGSRRNSASRSHSP